MSARFNQILVVDSLPSAERGLVDRLFEDMGLWAQVAGEAPAIVRRSLGGASELSVLLGECAELASRENYVPLLHIECHGHSEGLEFSDGSTLPWSDLKPDLVALNVATKLNLVVIVSACFGGDIARISGADDRAPFWGFVGPKESVSAGELTAAMSAFYQTLLTTKSTQLAMEALRRSEAGDKFWNLSAASIFRLIEGAYNRDYLTDQNVARRALVLRALAAQQGFEWRVEQVEQMIRDPRIMAEMRDHFFMVDLFPDHRERFAPG
jgi:hypothetical protein